MPRTSSEEALIDRSIYYSDSYFTKEQWLSHLAQIDFARELKPSNILEVGIGNGLTSMILKWLGFEVTTADVNSALTPDRVVSVLSLSEAFSGSAFDLVLCAEVIEHLPWESVGHALQELAQVSRKWVVLTVPEPFWPLFYFEMKIPKLPRFKIDWRARRKLIAPVHYWELGVIPRREFEKKISEHMQIERTGHLPGNLYHRYYLLNAGKGAIG